MAFLAIEKAGLVIVGVGVRAGPIELTHLLRMTAAVGIISEATHLGKKSIAWIEALRAAGVGLRHHIVMGGDDVEAQDPRQTEVADEPLDTSI